ncbi:MAG: hypothetical protein RLZZ210_1643 [Pseudomonadota bacterium]|jgi:murein DD-endopeptidase MepM/ murein hydrolase activator NlpD
MSKKFSGGNSLTQKDDLVFYIHKMMMVNELRGGHGAYQISNAEKGISGLSFGGIQRDISSKQNQPIFEYILKNATDTKGKNILTQNEIEQIKQHLYKPCNNFTQEDTQIYNQLKGKINQAISSNEGVAIINKDYEEQIYKKAKHVQDVIANIQNPQSKEFLQNNLTAQLIIADTFNQFGARDKNKLTVPEQLVKMLNEPDANIDIPFSNRSFKADDKIDIQDMINFKLATQYGQSNPKDTIRRIKNIQDITTKYSNKNDLFESLEKNIKHYILPENVKKNLDEDSKKHFDSVLRTILPNIGENKVHITSNFGHRVLNGKHGHHNGIDFNYVGGQSGINMANPSVHSPVSGTVVAASGKAGYGIVSVKDKDGFMHEILHLDSQVVKIGQSIKVNDVIGEMGGRGPQGSKQYANHVHYQIRNSDGKLVNPAIWWAENNQLNRRNDKITTGLSNEILITDNNLNINSKISSPWYPTPINITKSDERYQKIEGDIKLSNPEFSTMSFSEQEKIVRDYINSKNMEYAQNLKQTMQMTMSNTMNIEEQATRNIK